MIDICFYAADPPPGRLVATKREGMGQIHLLNDDMDATLCGQSTEEMATGVVRGELDRSHSDFCKRCDRVVA